MSARETVCLTFVGNPLTDSRCYKMAATLSSAYNVHIVALSDTEDISIPSVETHILARNPAIPLRRALFGFWKTGIAEARLTGAGCLLACDLYSLPLASRTASVSNKPYLYDSRELYSSIAALQDRRMIQRFWNIIERRYSSGASTIITVNHEIGEVLNRHYKDASIEVVHNYPDPLVQASAEAPSKLRETLGIPKDTKVLISNGGLQKGRGLFSMIDMLPLLPECRLVFLGDGPLRGELEVYAHGLEVHDRVHFLCVPATEVISWTKGADIGLCFIENLGVSYYLSLPNKMFEYLHAGIPCISTDLPVLKRVMGDTKAGLLVRHGDYEDAVMAARFLLSDAELYSACVRNARSAVPDYSWETEGKRLIRLVGDAIAARRS